MLGTMNHRFFVERHSVYPCGRDDIDPHFDSQPKIVCYRDVY